MLDKSPKQYNKNQKAMSIYVGDEEGRWCQVSAPETTNDLDFDMLDKS
jgi:hypothetical protein